MTAQVLQGLMAYTPFAGSVPTGSLTTSLGSTATFTFNAAGDKVAFVFQMPSTTVPDLVAFVIDAVSVAGTAGAIDCTLETLAADGTPSGTPVTNSATASVTASTTGVKTATGMAGTAAVVQGTAYAVVIAAGAGWDRTLTIKMVTGATNAMAIPYSLTKDTAGAWTKSGVTNAGWCLGLANVTPTYIHVPGLLGAYSAAALTTYTNATNPDERGNRFNLPVPVTIVGALVVMTTSSVPDSTNGFTVSLYSSHTATRVQLATLAFDGDAQTNGMFHMCLFNTGVDLTASTTYAIGVKSDSTGNLLPIRWDYTANADLNGHLGLSFYSTTANNGGDFTDDSAKVYSVYPIFSKFSDGAGGAGGLLTHPGMAGGMRG